MKMENDEREFLSMMRARITAGYGLSNGEALMLLDSAEKAVKSTPDRRLDAMDERLNKAARVVDSVAQFMHKLEKRVDRLEDSAPEVQMKVTKDWFDNNAARIGGLELENRVLRKKLFRRAYT